MVVVAVAGGLGDFGRLIVDALLESGKHEVYSISRKKPDNLAARVSPDGKEYLPVIQSDYKDEAAIKTALEEKQVHTIISALNVDFEDVCNAQVRLIRAAAASDCVKRLIPSEYNVDYELPDEILPYPEKRLHVAARRALEQTDLEYTYIYPGMFMDYFGLPRFKTHMRPIYVVLDLERREAGVPGDGTARMAITLTKDAATYIAATLELEAWPRELKIVASEPTLLELVEIARKARGGDLEVYFDSLESLLGHQAQPLKANLENGALFDGGSEQLGNLFCDLHASIALGAYDLTKNSAAVDLVELLQGKVARPTTVEEFLHQVWAEK